MTDALFDTTVFIDYYRGDPGAQDLIEQVLNGELIASYPSLTVFELWLGTMNAQEEAIHTDVLSVLEEACLNNEAAKRAAPLLRTLPIAERQRLIGDAFIAATAIVLEEPIYTRNTADFQRLGAPIRTY